MKNLTPSTMLSEEQIDAFFEIGFVIVPDVFTPTEIEEMRAGFDRLQKMAYSLSEAGIHKGSDFAIDRLESGRVIIQRISWCGAAEPVLLAYGKDRRLLGMASQLLGSNEMNQLINQAPLQNTRRQRGISVASGQRAPGIWETLVEGRQRTRQLCPTSHRH